MKFKVTWTVDGQALLNKNGKPVVKTLLANDHVAFLDAKMLKGNLNKMVITHKAMSLFSRYLTVFANI